MIKRFAAVVLSLLLVLIAVVVGVSAPAAASVPGGSVSMLTDVATGACLNSGWAQGNGQSPVWTSGCGGDFATWSVVYSDYNGNSQIIDKVTGLCLGGDYNGSISTAGCNGGTFQSWRVAPSDASGSAPNELRNAATGLCLDSNSQDKAYTLGCNGGNNQRWQQSITTFNLRSGNGECVGVWAGLAGAWVTCTGNADQQWHWGVGNHHGYNELINGNNQCLGVVSASTQVGARISAGPCTGNGDQFWTRTYAPYGPSSRLQNYNSNLVLGVYNGAAVDGAEMVQWTVAGVDQFFTIPTPSFSIENVGAPGKCIGTDIYRPDGGLWWCTTLPDQVWRWGGYNGQGSNQLLDGYDRCLGVPSGSTAPGAVVQAAPCNGGDDQYWSRVADTSPPYSYYLKNYKSGLVIGVGAASTANGATLVQWFQQPGSPNQHWSGP